MEEEILATINGLEFTATEKIYVLGKEGAKKDIKLIRKMIVELVEFWELDNNIIKRFDEAMSK